MLNKIKNIEGCIEHLQKNYQDITDYTINPGYLEAIEDLKSYLEYEKDYLNDMYNEHTNDYTYQPSESKYCF